MNIDRYTKITLTVIAAALVVIAINGSKYISPASAADPAFVFASNEAKIIAHSLDEIAKAINRIADRL